MTRQPSVGAAAVLASLLAALGCSGGAAPTPAGSGGAGPGNGSGGERGTGGASGTGGAGVGGSAVGSGGAVAGTGGAGVDAGADAGTGGRTGAGGAGIDAGAGGAGGAVSCAGHAVAFNANIPGNNDPAKARVMVDFMNSADLPVGNTTRTIELWALVKTSSWVGDANTLFFYGTNNRVADGFGLDFGGTPGTIDPFTNAIFDNDNQPTGLGTASDQWVHFAMTWDGTTVRAFVNGVEKATKASTVAQKTLMTGRTPLTIGGYDPAFFNGSIDEFRIWNVARSAAEITRTMHTTLAGNEPGLVGYWKFDETGGTSAADSTSSAGHTAHPGVLMATGAGNLPVFVVSTAPITCTP
jgi:hypothetical protein